MRRTGAVHKRETIRAMMRLVGKTSRVVVTFSRQPATICRRGNLHRRPTLLTGNVGVYGEELAALHVDRGVCWRPFAYTVRLTD